MQNLNLLLIKMMLIKKNLNLNWLQIVLNLVYLYFKLLSGHPAHITTETRYHIVSCKFYKLE